MLIILSLLCKSVINEVHGNMSRPIHCSKRNSLDMNIPGRWVNAETVSHTRSIYPWCEFENDWFKNTPTSHRGQWVKCGIIRWFLNNKISNCGKDYQIFIDYISFHKVWIQINFKISQTRGCVLLLPSRVASVKKYHLLCIFLRRFDVSESWVLRLREIIIWQITKVLQG